MKTISLFPTYGTLGKIYKEQVYATTHLSTGLPAKAKRLITRKLNLLIAELNPSGIKIGKTGQYNTRHNGQCYKNFDQMYILYKSSSKELVQKIEGYYIDYIKEHYPTICYNINKGSAGPLESTNGFYYVYLAIVL